MDVVVAAIARQIDQRRNQGAGNAAGRSRAGDVAVEYMLYRVCKRHLQLIGLTRRKVRGRRAAAVVSSDDKVICAASCECVVEERVVSNVSAAIHGAAAPAIR